MGNLCRRDRDLPVYAPGLERKNQWNDSNGAVGRRAFVHGAGVSDRRGAALHIVLHSDSADWCALWSASLTPCPALHLSATEAALQ